MKKSSLFFALICIMLASLAEAGSVRGYYRQDGIYVQPHQRSNPDSSYNNNWSTQGNTNPYTGQSGTNSPTWNDKSPDYNKKHYGNDGRVNGGSYGSSYGNFGKPNNDDE